MSGHIFGPVPSRRLGRSLGVDLVPLKTCTYDCIYCQLGRTTCKTVERKEWAPLGDVVAELETALTRNPDYITLGGSGEPTLYCRIDELIDRIKAMTDLPVAVLTNGSLLWREDVRRQLMKADLVIPSLDAGDEAMFRWVNRPHQEISFEKLLAGLIEFRRMFRGQYWLEVLLLGNYGGIEAEFANLIRSVELIEPDRLQLNTATRPPAEAHAIGLSPDRLARTAAMFDPPAEVIADFRGVHQQADFCVGRQEVLDLLRRRPCSIDDIADGLGIHRNEALKHIEELNAEKLVEKTLTADKLHYKAAEGIKT